MVWVLPIALLAAATLGCALQAFRGSPLAGGGLALAGAALLVFDVHVAVRALSFEMLIDKSEVRIGRLGYYERLPWDDIVRVESRYRSGDSGVDLVIHTPSKATMVSGLDDPRAAWGCLAEIAASRGVELVSDGSVLRTVDAKDRPR